MSDLLILHQFRRVVSLVERSIHNVTITEDANLPSGRHLPARIGFWEVTDDGSR